MYYENDDEFEQDLLNSQSPIKRYNKYNKYYLTHNNNNNNNKINKIIKNNQNVISRPINHQIITFHNLIFQRISKEKAIHKMEF